jgi:hypothetical protein
MEFEDMEYIQFAQNGKKQWVLCNYGIESLGFVMDMLVTHVTSASVPRNILLL